MFTSAQLASMLSTTGRTRGVTVTYGNESTPGHYEVVPDTGLPGELGRQFVSGPSVVIAAGALTAFGPNRGIGESVVLAGTAANPSPEYEGTWYVHGVEPHETAPDGHLLRLMLSRSRHG